MKLLKVTSENFYDLMRLSVEESQKDFVAPNDYSLAEAYAALSAGQFVQAFGLYDGDTPVGFAMVSHDAVPNEDCPVAYRDTYYLWRFMIDKRYQGRGYGRAGVALVLDYIRTFPDGPSAACTVSYEPENTVAKHLYESFGFRPTGEWDDGEEIALLEL